MLILNGNNLGERHRDLNKKVKDAVDKQTDFDEVKSQLEECDVDKLFKIDLAMRYKNIDYILEVLKCGDAFHITRALKCLWLYDNDFSQFINTGYLESSIFPFMSMKMKRKMLTTISVHVRNDERAIDFYEYCKRAEDNEYAFKFLVFTPDHFKLDMLKNESNFDGFSDSKFLKQFIGSSFVLGKAYANFHCYSNYVIHELRFLYSVSDEEYLRILEHYTTIYEYSYSNNFMRLGIRTSRHILQNHRQRVIDYPLLYINKLNKGMLVRYLTIKDVTSLGFALLPNLSKYFWSGNFYNTYKFIFDKIPANEIFAYLKQLYTSKYKGDFEMRIEFYELNYYEMLTIEEREAWALRHIERDEELPGIEYFIWYRFVSCDKALSAIKRFIFLTPDAEERSRIINILPETARSQEDLIKILSYYYQRHVNEREEHRESFINEIIKRHDIYSFNSECWTLLDQLFYSLNVYSTATFVRASYKARSMIYYIIYEKEFPEALQEYADYFTEFYSVREIINGLSTDRRAVVAKYLNNRYVERIKCLKKQLLLCDDKAEDNIEWGIECDISCLINKIHHVIECFDRPLNEIPDIVHQPIKPDEEYRCTKTKFIPNTEGDFVRWLKQGIQTAIDGINKIRCNTYRWRFRLTRLFRKLKVYFPNDVGIKYLEYFTNYLSDVPKGWRKYRNIKMAVVGVFYLSDKDFKVEFFEKYAPASPKIDHKNIDNRVLQIQKAICRLAYHLRPPLNLSSTNKYIIGDYVHFCLPMFNSYLANMPSTREFIDAVLNAPLSIQKHGLRLAFIAYSPETLKPIIIGAWNRTKNVSLRKILYETLFYRIINENEEAQKELYEVLKTYTTKLNHDDHDEVYSLLVSDHMPDVLKGDFIETAWLTVSKLSDKAVDIKRRISVICHMEQHIHLVQREFPRLQIIDDHVDAMLNKENLNKDYNAYTTELCKTKWTLTAKYIVSFNNKEEQTRSLDILQAIMSKCIDSWSFVKEEMYTVRNFMFNLVEIIMKKDPKNKSLCGYMVPIYQCILNKFRNSLKIEEVHEIKLLLKLCITCRKIIHRATNEVDNETGKPRNMSDSAMACTFGENVAKLVKNLVQNDEFHHCSYQTIANVLSTIEGQFCDIVNMNDCQFMYNVCDRLTDMKMKETHLLALFMLPRDPRCAWTSEHARSLKKLQKFKCEEVRSFLYEKYVMSDCTVRSYVKE